MTMISVAPRTESDQDFASLVSRVCTSEARLLEPEFVYIVEVDHCFDRKWKAFSGVIDLQLGTWLGPHLRVPPFHPHRVVRELVYQRDAGAEGGYRAIPAKPLHINQASHRNVHRQLRRIVPSGLFVWYSGGTAVAEQGTILTYRIKPPQEASWFASFRKSRDWRIDRMHGISRRALELLVGPHRGEAAPN